MRNIYQCKVCFETFSLLRYLRKHVTIPAVGDHHPNKCQSYYSGTGNLQANLKVNHRIVTENTPTEEIKLTTQRQRVQLNSTCHQEKTGYSKDDECRNIEDEHACLKFEPDEQDEIYFFDRETSILQNNDIANNPPQRFMNNEEKTIEGNHETNFIEDGEQNKASIKQAIFKLHNNETIENRNDILGGNTTELNPPVETTICKKCKLACTSLENLCIHYETLHKLPVVVLNRALANQRNSKCKQTEINNSKEAIKRNTTHKCAICSKTFPSLRYLKGHKSSMHDGKTFDCNECQKTFPWLMCLKRHKLIAHDGIRYKCNTCAKEFSQLSDLNRHKAGVHDNIRFKCDICQKQFNWLSNLRIHKLNVHEHMRYKCNDCSKQFNSSQSLGYHEASTHKGIRYKCELCEKKFSRKFSLSKHKASSHDGVRYKCKLCEKQFHSRHNLREHKQSSHDGVRYKCDSCPKEYNFPATLRRHKSVEHNTQ